MKDRDWRAEAAADTDGMLPSLHVAYWRRRTEVQRRLLDLACRRREEFMRTRALAVALGMRWAALELPTMKWWSGRLTSW